MKKEELKNIILSSSEEFWGKTGDEAVRKIQNDLNLCTEGKETVTPTEAIAFAIASSRNYTEQLLYSVLSKVLNVDEE